MHPGGPATFDVLADDVVALIEALEPHRALIAGFSEGGATATYTAVRRPGVVRAVVNHAGFDYFDPEHMALLIAGNFRPLFGGRPDATSADPYAAELASRSIPTLAATFATVQADYDDAQSEGH